MNNNRMDGKLWNGSKKTVKLRISIYGKQNCIQIGKDVLRILGAPLFICLKINKEMNSIVVEPAQEKTALSFRVPDGILFNHKQMIITSASFVIGLMAMNDLDFNETYQIDGIYSEKNNATVFNIHNSKLYVPKKKKTINNSGFT